MSLIADIKRHEGYRKLVYKDHLGNDTIGYGFLISSLELEEDLCDLILDRKLKKHEKVLKRNLEWYDDCSDELKDILQELFYQLYYKLFDFKKTLYYLETEQYEEASIEILDSLWARQCKNRAKEISERIASLSAN